MSSKLKLSETDLSDEDLKSTAALPNFVFSPIELRDLNLDSGDSLTTKVEDLNRREKAHSQASSVSWDQGTF
jgi:hypothetical protein